MKQIVFFDGHRAYWTWPGSKIEIRSRVAEPGSYIFTDEGIQLFSHGDRGSALCWPADLNSSGRYLARWLDADLVTDRAEYERRRHEEIAS